VKALARIVDKRTTATLSVVSNGCVQTGRGVRFPIPARNLDDTVGRHFEYPSEAKILTSLHINNDQ